MPKKSMSSDDLRRFALLKNRRMQANLELPEEKRLTKQQIEDYTRQDVKNGRVNSHGFVVEVP
tara:strand:- start:511 stop:699 length:189 start_codon:yes stop_codon:yes gene_type:complete